MIQKKNALLNFPIVRRCDQTDDFFGRTVRDPYRWLEDNDSEETKQFVEEQCQVTAGYFGEEFLSETRTKISQSFEEMYFYDKLSLPGR